MSRPTDGSDFDEGLEVDPQGSRFTTAGNEADVEDNVQLMYIPTPQELFRKLKTKPVECCIPTTPCRIHSARDEFNKSRRDLSANAGERLTVRPKSAIEGITDTISRPEGAVPPLALPVWHCLPLEQKIPLIPAPAGLFYYTPGRVSTKMHRKPKVYSTLDPYNRERCISSPYKEYTALHDPHAKDFMKRPETRRLLYRQGLINEKDEIMYSLKEFNKFRDYLRTLYTDEVHENVHVADELWRAEQEQLKVIRKYISTSDGVNAARKKRLKKARWFVKETRELNRSRLVRRRQEIEARTAAFMRTKEVINTEKVVRSLEKSRLQKEKLRKLAQAQRQHIIASLHQSLRKEIESFERRNQDRLIIKQAQENFLLEWMDAKINFSKLSMDKTASLNTAWHESLKSKAKKRQKKIEKHRENLPKIIQQRKEYEAYRWGLARKYFYIWLNKTRARLTAPEDNLHESTFIKGASGTLEQTLQYLHFQAGNEERLDTFILNIMRLKEEIKRQLAMEEDEHDALEDHDEFLEREVKKRLSQYYGPDELKSLEEAAQSKKELEAPPKARKSKKSTVMSHVSKKSLVPLTPEDAGPSIE